MPKTRSIADSAPSCMGRSALLKHPDVDSGRSADYHPRPDHPRWQDTEPSEPAVEPRSMCRKTSDFLLPSGATV